MTWYTGGKSEVESNTWRCTTLNMPALCCRVWVRVPKGRGEHCARRASTQGTPVYVSKQALCRRGCAGWQDLNMWQDLNIIGLGLVVDG